MGLMAELQRRNVIRMAGLYLVGAWLITQVAGTVLPMFGAPEWIARSVVILLAIGFVPALVNTSRRRSRRRRDSRHWPNAVTGRRQLLAWALGDTGTRSPDFDASSARTFADEVLWFFIARQDIEDYNENLRSLGSIIQASYFANLYSSKPAGHAMLRDPRVKAKLVDFGFVACWREKGRPDAGRWATRISNAAPTRRRCIEMSLIGMVDPWDRCGPPVLERPGPHAP